MTHIDRSYLSGDYPSDGFDGLVARFYHDGHLEFLGYFENGECLRSIELDGLGAGHGTNYKGSGGTTENVQFSGQTFVTRVKQWIEWIEELDLYQGGHGNMPY